MRFARKLALTATLFACIVSVRPGYAQQEVDPTYYPPIPEPTAPSHQHAAVAKKSKTSASSAEHHKPELKPIAKKQSTATVKPAVRK